MENWVVLAKQADFKEIGRKFGIDQVIARVIRNRDVIGDEAIHEYLHGGRECLRDPFELKDMDRAAEILKAKIRDGRKIRIVGDYDIDGVMSSYILKRGITGLGGTADIRIPNRTTDGYGINERMIREAYDDGIDTIITCDNGIAAFAPVKLAKELGMTVIVTDHHEVSELPEADAVVDPKRPDDTSVNKHLCGAGVAWKLVLAIGGDPDLRMLQYAAFATVGDIVDLVGENRIIVKEGLKQLHSTDNAGLIALADACGVVLDQINTYHIGFQLGPCLNASGRLDTAMRALELLESAEYPARVIAQELKALNDSRKSMTETGVSDAEEIIKRDGLEKDRILVIFLPDVHESVAGIIAGRLRERTGKPCFVLTKGEECVKGSGRSTEKYNMFVELERISDLLLKFGGHAMAAGFSLEEDKIGQMRERLNENCTLSKEELCPKLRIDVPMPISYVTEELVEQLKLLEPYGKGNEKPLFAEKHVILDHPKLFGANRSVLKARVQSLGTPGDSDPERLGFQADKKGLPQDLVCFRNAEELYNRILENPDVSIVYTPHINEYMGARRIQIVVERFR